MIRLNAISIGYKKEEVLITCDELELKERELIALIGFNGSGKSTLIKTISGLLKPLKGKIEINNSDLAKLSAQEISKHVALVTTERIDYGIISVFDLVALGRSPYTAWHGQLTENDISLIERSIIATHIEHLTWKMYSELSDGEKQRVLIARALAQDTPILIMDEPTAFLDALQRRKLMKLLISIKEEFSKSILISTHEIELATEFSDKMWIIESGKLISCNEQSEMKNKLSQLFKA